MKKYLALGAVLVAILGIVLLHGAGTAREGLQPRAYLPLVEQTYGETPLPSPVAWRATHLSGPPGYVTSVAATREGGLLTVSLTDAGLQAYRSVDEGASWTIVDEPVLGRETRPYRLYSSPPGSRKQAMFALGFSGLAMSRDGGVSWQSVGGNLPVKQTVAMAFAPGYEDDGTVYTLSAPAEGIDPYLYVSKDRGESWQVLADVADIRNGGLVPNDLATFGPEVLVIATSRGVLRTEDSGNTWHHEYEAFAEPGREPAIRAIATLPSGTILVVSSGQRIPYVSADGGRTWRWTGRGMDKGGQYQGGLALAAAPGRLFLAAAGDQGAAPGLFYSPDGESWRAIPLGLEAETGISALYAISDDRLLVAAGEGGLWKVEALP